MADEKNDIHFEEISKELEKVSPTTRKRVFEKFILAALGSIPWVGGFISAAAEFKFDESDIREDNLQSKWLEEHEFKIKRLTDTLEDIAKQFEVIGPEIDERIQSEDYLDLVRKSFRTWDRADTAEKRKYVANLVTNSCATQLCSDDVVRLFIDWLDAYHEAHFAVIREIYQNPRCTRYDIWKEINGEFPREDSAEADLFKLLIET